MTDLETQETLTNDLVWESPKNLTDKNPKPGYIRKAHYIRKLLSLTPTVFEGVCERASVLRHGVPSTVDLSKYSVGACNIAFLITFNDNVRWVLRITIPLIDNNGDLAMSYESKTTTSMKIHSAVETMKYVRANTNIPVPQVYFHDAGHNNPFEAPYMVMDFIDGVPYPYLDIDQDDTMRVTKLYEQICRIAFDLSKLRFHRIGSILNAQDPTALFGPKIWDDIECAPFHNPHDYYKALANHYWNEAISSITPEISTVPENWTWKTAPYSERNLFTAFLRVVCLRLIDSEHLGTEFCLQHQDFKLRNILVKDDQVVGVIDWDESGIVPFLGYDPVSFTLTGELDMGLKKNSEIERAETGENSITRAYKSRVATLARFLESSLLPYRRRASYGPVIFEHLYGLSWDECPDHVKRSCMQEALKLAAPER
jgi:hypothetical protein